MSPQHAVKVTFTDPIYTELGREANLAGMSIAQFVREATIVRLAYRRARRGEDVDLAQLELVRRKDG
jgi:hypothetical protein